MVIHINKKYLCEIYIILYLFFVIFSPPIIPKMHIFVGIFSIIMCLAKYRKVANDAFIKSGMFRFFLGMLIFFTFAAITTIISIVFYNDVVQLGNYKSLYNRYFSVIVLIMPCSLYLGIYLRKWNYKFKDLIRFIINAALIETVLVLLALLVPSIKVLFQNLMSIDNEYLLSVRYYGLASNMLDHFGWGMGLIAGISFFYGLKEKNRYIVYSFMILIAGLLNSRTTIVMYAVGVVFSLIHSVINKEIKLQIKGLFCVLLFLSLASVVVSTLLKNNEQTYYWIQSGVDSMVSLLQRSSEKTDFASILFLPSWWELPKGFRLMVGTGHSRFLADGYKHTDVGYVNEIWFVGIVGVAILYATLASLFYKFYRSEKNILGTFLVWYMALAICIFNVKSCAFGQNPGAAVTFVILFVSVYLKNANRDKLSEEKYEV